MKHRDGFDRVAANYERYRPSYPDAFVDAFVSRGLVGGRVLELACGSGQMTARLAERGLSVDALEWGETLAKMAREKFHDNPRVNVTQADVETWVGEPEKYACVLSATAFHWLDASLLLPRILRWLKPGGVLCLCWNLVSLQQQAPAFVEGVSSLLAPSMGTGSSFRLFQASVEEQIKRHREGLSLRELFGNETVQRVPWEETYTTAQFQGLMSTWSPVFGSEPSEKERILRGVGALVDALGGKITWRYECVGFFATRR